MRSRSEPQTPNRGDLRSRRRQRSTSVRFQEGRINRSLTFIRITSIESSAVRLNRPLSLCMNRGRPWMDNVLYKNPASESGAFITFLPGNNIVMSFNLCLRCVIINDNRGSPTEWMAGLKREKTEGEMFHSTPNYDQLPPYDRSPAFYPVENPAPVQTEPDSSCQSCCYSTACPPPPPKAEKKESPWSQIITSYLNGTAPSQLREQILKGGGDQSEDDDDIAGIGVGVTRCCVKGGRHHHHNRQKKRLQMKKKKNKRLQQQQRKRREIQFELIRTNGDTNAGHLQQNQLWDEAR